MKFDVFFEANPSDCPSQIYVASQPIWQQSSLQLFVKELLEKNKIDHRDARRITNDRWSLWVRQDGQEAVNHVCYLAKADEPVLSDFAKMLLSDAATPAIEEVRQPAMQLMIINTNSHAVSIGRADELLDPGYYASLMDLIQKEIFLKTIQDIQNGYKTNDYSLNADGSIAIHINKPEVAYGIHITCAAKWSKT